MRENDVDFEASNNQPSDETLELIGKLRADIEKISARLNNNQLATLEILAGELDESNEELVASVA